MLFGFLSGEHVAGEECLKRPCQGLILAHTLPPTKLGVIECCSFFFAGTARQAGGRRYMTQVGVPAELRARARVCTSVRYVFYSCHTQIRMYEHKYKRRGNSFRFGSTVNGLTEIHHSPGFSKAANRRAATRVQSSTQHLLYNNSSRALSKCLCENHDFVVFVIVCAEFSRIICHHERAIFQAKIKHCCVL